MKRIKKSKRVQKGKSDHLESSSSESEDDLEVEDIQESITQNLKDVC